MKNNVFIVIALGIVALSIGFYGGMIYGKNSNPNPNPVTFRENGVESGLQRGIGGNPGNAGLITGEIINKDDKSITVKLRNGGSKIVFLSDSAQIMKSVGGTLDDLIIGSQATVTGSANSDGSVTAQVIQTRSN